MSQISSSSCYQTFMAFDINPLSPDIDKIDIRNIAHSLSNQCRFMGHSRRFISVAEHSVSVSEIVPAEYAMEALLHDAAESVLGDVTTALKKSSIMSGYRDLESKWQSLIYDKFGVRKTAEGSLFVKAADTVALAIEADSVMYWEKPCWDYIRDRLRDVTVSSHISGLSPQDAEKQFLLRYNELCDHA